MEEEAGHRDMHPEWCLDDLCYGAAEPNAMPTCEETELLIGEYHSMWLDPRVTQLRSMTEWIWDKMGLPPAEFKWNAFKAAKTREEIRLRRLNGFLVAHGLTSGASYDKLKAVSQCFAALERLVLEQARVYARMAPGCAGSFSAHFYL